MQRKIILRTPSGKNGKINPTISGNSLLVLERFCIEGYKPLLLAQVSGTKTISKAG